MTRDYRQSDKAGRGWVQCIDGILGDPDAYNEDADAGPSSTPDRDASVTSDLERARDASTPDAETSHATTTPDAGTSEDSSTPDAGTPRKAERDDAASGCNVVKRHSNLLTLILVCAAALAASRRRKR